MSDNTIQPSNVSETTQGSPDIAPLSLEEQTIVKSDEIWFDDGNIILQTADKRYRVHKSLLAIHSSVFKDMISVPQPVEQPEVFDGCPVIHLTDQTYDWDLFLPLLYGKSDMRDMWGQIEVLLMVAMLRLGQKYGFDRFKAEAYRQFQQVYPAEFGLYEKVLSDGSSQQWQRCITLDTEFYLLDIALELEIQSALPLAFFICLRDRSITEIFNGYYERISGEGVFCLSLQTRATLLAATQPLIDDISKEVYSWWRQAKTSSKCTTKETCANAIRNVATDMIGVSPKIRELFLLNIDIMSIKGLCIHCRKFGRTSTKTAQQSIFNKLPSYFGLPQWDDLKDFEFDM